MAWHGMCSHHWLVGGASGGAVCLAWSGRQAGALRHMNKGWPTTVASAAGALCVGSAPHVVSVPQDVASTSVYVGQHEHSPVKYSNTSASLWVALVGAHMMQTTAAGGLVTEAAGRPSLGPALICLCEAHWCTAERAVYQAASSAVTRLAMHACAWPKSSQPQLSMRNLAKVLHAAFATHGPMSSPALGAVSGGLLLQLNKLASSTPHMSKHCLFVVPPCVLRLQKGPFLHPGCQEVGDVVGCRQ